MVDPKILGTAGLTCDFVGAILLALGLFVTKQQAVDLSLSRWSGTFEQNLKLPMVQDRLLQSKRAVWGCVLLGVGAVLQIAAVWQL